MVGGPTGRGARGEGGSPVVAEGEAVENNLSNASMSREDVLVALVDNPGKALDVVQHEVARRKLFTEKQNDEFLPEHQGDGGRTVVASNVLSHEKLKGLDLRGVDATNTFVLLESGATKLLGDFIRSLNEPDKVKNCLQGLVYNADTKFFNEEGKNKKLLDFLGHDNISSEYTGEGRGLVQVASLVEPSLKRFTDLLIPSEAAARPEFAGAGDTVEAGTSPARKVGGPESAGDAATVGPDNASLGQVGSQEQPNTSENEALKPHENGEDTDSQDSLRQQLSKLLSSRAQFIRREVSSSEEAEPENGNRESTEDEDVQLVKAWLRKQFSSEPFGVIREVVSADAAAGTTEGDGGSGESLKADTSTTYNSSVTNSAGNFGAIVRQNSSAQDVLANLRQGMIEIGNQSDVLADKCFSVEKLSDGQCVIYPVLYSLREGRIDRVSLGNFYEVIPGQDGTGYGITVLAKIEIDQGDQISVTEKGKLFLPPDHPYFTEKTASPS
jgi:hypothetical protein